MGQYGVGRDGYWGMGGIAVIIVTRYHIRYVRISENTGWMRVSYHYLLMLIVVVLPHTGQFIKMGDASIRIFCYILLAASSA